MRFIYLLLITYFISSCATNKVRLVKNNDFHKTVVTVDHDQDENNFAVSNYESTNEIISEAIPSITSDKPDIEDKNLKEKSKKRKTIKKEIDNEEIIKAARYAELKAKKSLDQSYIGGGLFLLSFIPFVFFGAITMLILSLVNYSKANRSRYITPDGENYLNTTRIILFTVGIILFLLASLVLAFVLL